MTSKPNQEQIRAKFEAIRESINKIEAELEACRKILKGDLENDRKQYFCGQCSHWKDRCLKGYTPHENSHTVACREFLEGRSSL